jgi:soluble lytic murein transglycosylase-like protein
VLAAPAPVPTTPSALVASWQRTERSLSTAIAAWDKSRAPSPSVTGPAQYEQRVIRLLARRPALAREVERRLPVVTSDVVARGELNRLAAKTPPPPTPPRLGAPAPAASLLAWYRQAGRRFRIRWQLLAAVNFVESAFGRVKNMSSAGAQGPMQFLPSTWRRYGLGGDVHDPHDAILGAANYLAANGGRRDERAALHHYNPSPLYVDAVRRYAGRMTHDVTAFYAYYCWRVYFRRR